jgi:integrase/recombinase XerD
LPEEKIEELKNRMEEPYKSVFIFLLNTGLRIGEFLALLDKPAKISSSNNALIITGKGTKIRQIPLNPTALECFLRVKEFHLEKEKLSYFKIWNRFQEYGIHPHMIRHTFATQLLKKGVDIGTLRDLLGHSNIRITSIYIDLVNPEKIKIPEL